MTSESGSRRWMMWIVSGLLGLAFLGAGGTKLAGLPMHVEHFAGWGYPPWFLYVTGALEVLGAIAILVPRTRLFGAAVLVCVMLGAVTTHVKFGEWDRILPPLVLLALAIWVARAVQRRRGLET